jgi:NAD-dependent dihydropyrimidine dehydrogenase PreA subunit
MSLAYLSGVVSLAYSPEKCTGCGRCAEVCPRAVFVMDGPKAKLAGRDNCIECGACGLNCAFGAITVKRGVGCASAIINGIVTKGDPDLGTCDCGKDSGGCC